jgi:hypothetical protein
LLDFELRTSSMFTVATGNNKYGNKQKQNKIKNIQTNQKWGGKKGVLPVTDGDRRADGGTGGTAMQDMTPGREYHTVISAAGSATHWQSRVGYYHFMKIKRRCQREWGPRCAMGGFTRLLHTGSPDDLMGEIPTHVVKPLQDKDDKGCGSPSGALAGSWVSPWVPPG